ncbi:MAG: hypothetical protein ISR55_12105 [Bacteroidetes bacterium]|nr:hypothetical protein [Bacteroidota bacterium]
MKNSILIACILLATATQAKTKYETVEFYLRLALAECGETVYVKNAGIPLSSGDKGLIYSIDHTLSEVNDEMLGYGVIQNPDQGSSIIQLFFLHEADEQEFYKKGSALIRMAVEIPKLSYRSIFFELTQRNIFMMDVEEKGRFYDIWDVLEEDNEMIENAILARMLEDIHFTASAMRDQMESPMIKEGPYSGTDLFTVMEESTDKDLMEFLIYVSARPRIYMGAEWKASEIYATWLYEGAPMVVKE